MIKNYIVIAKRVLLNKFVFTLLNISGLAIGIAAAALIFHYISFEKSFDNYHPNSENIYRLSYGRISSDGSNVEFASACPAIGPLLVENYPDIVRLARLAQREATFAYEESKFIESKIYYAEQEIFNILHFNIIQGSIKEALSQHNNIVISKDVAERYFGESNPIGKRLKLNKVEDYQVVAVFDNVPDNSHLKPEILIAFPNLTDWRDKDYLESWGHTGAFTYLVLKSEANPRELEKQFIKFTETQIGEMLSYYEMVMYFKLQSIEDIHLTSHLLQEQEVNGDEKSVKFLYLIGIFIIVIAWVNYINLTTSRSMERAREVGVRKLVGAARWNLIKQFYTESAIINLISILIATVLIELLKPAFSLLTGVPNDYKFWSQSWFLIFVIGTYFIGTFITGMYPVFALSSFKPVVVLKGKLISTTKGLSLRKILVVFQLMISIILISSTFAVFTQLKFMRSQKLGFDIEQTLVIDIPKAVDSTFIQRKETFKQEIAKLTGVKGVAFSTEVPGRKLWWDNGGIFKVGQDATSGKNYMIMGIDDQLIDIYKMEFKNGRNFSREFPSDKEAVIINETAVKWLEFESPEEALNKQIDYWGNIYTIIGVLKDYRHESPKALPEPQIFRYLPNENRFGSFSVKFEEKTVKSNLKNIEKLWNKLFSGNPFDYFFLDVYYNEQFKEDIKFGKVFGIFSFLAIFITCLGLFGLSLYTANLKTKEIGIRKVLGAKVSSILINITKEYIYLIFIALIMSIPILIWGINQWLNNFSIKMNISVWLFIIPAIMVFLITMISVSSHTIKAARRKPVDTLKYE
ncbi:MAG: FtsX-like permease family protein [Bacteroidales bacterium]|nr:FtsX-like permease family protein [Bacteroidales bacterium]